MGRFSQDQIRKNLPKGSLFIYDRAKDTRFTAGNAITEINYTVTPAVHQFSNEIEVSSVRMKISTSNTVITELTMP